MGSKSDISFARRTVKNSVSGTISGVALCLVGHPLDTLKIRLQTQPTDKPIYRGLADCFFKTLKWEGLGGFYRGVWSPIVGQMALRAVAFSSYYQITALLAGPERTRTGERLAHWEYFLVGMLNGPVTGLVESPIDLFKTKMQIQIIRAKSGATVQYRNVFHAAGVIYREHGVRGCFQGLGATCLRDTPAFSFYFGIFEYLKFYFTPVGGTAKDLKEWHVFMSGGLAGLSFWLSTYPLDVIKSSMQSDDSDRSKRKFRNIVDCAVKLYRDEGGWRRFFRGFSPCLLRSIPANATMLYVMDRCRIYLEPYL